MSSRRSMKKRSPLWIKLSYVCAEKRQYNVPVIKVANVYSADLLPAIGRATCLKRAHCHITLIELQTAGHW